MPIWLDSTSVCSATGARNMLSEVEWGFFLFYFFSAMEEKTKHCSKTDILEEGGEEELPRCSLRRPQYLFVLSGLPWLHGPYRELDAFRKKQKTKTPKKQNKDSFVVKEKFVFGSFQLGKGETEKDV